MTPSKSQVPNEPDGHLRNAQDCFIPDESLQDELIESMGSSSMTQEEFDLIQSMPWEYYPETFGDFQEEILLGIERDEASCVPVLFPKPEAGDMPGASEIVPAQEIEGGQFRITGIPSVVIGVNFGDIITVHLVDGNLVFEQVAKSSGHKTCQLSFASPDGRSGAKIQLAELSMLGCTFEEVSQSCWAMDIPPEADSAEIRAILAKAASKKMWVFCDGRQNPAQ